MSRLSLPEYRKVTDGCARGIHAPRQRIGRHGRLADPLRVAANAPPEQRLHLPEPVLRMNKAQCGEGVRHRPRTDMRDAPGIARHLHRMGQRRDDDRRLQVGNVVGGGQSGRGHNRSISGFFPSIAGLFLPRKQSSECRNRSANCRGRPLLQGSDAW